VIPTVVAIFAVELTPRTPEATDVTLVATLPVAFAPVEPAAVRVVVAGRDAAPDTATDPAADTPTVTV